MPKSRDYDEVPPGVARDLFDHDARVPPPKPVANGHAPADVPVLPPIYSKREFLAGYVPPDYLIDRVLQRRFIYSLTGQTGHAKTAIALRIAKLVGQAHPARLAGHDVEPGQVLYMVGENPEDVRMRIMGEDGVNPYNAHLDRVYFMPGKFDIDQLFPALQAYVSNIGDMALVVVDTSAAYFLGNEELSNTQMGEHARKLRRLTTLPGGPCVVVLCHPIKHATEPSQLLPRGGGAFLAEIDGNLTAWLNGSGVIELSHGKMRGPGFEPITFKLDHVTVPGLVDSKQRMLPTVRAVSISDTEQEQTNTAELKDEDTLLIARLFGPKRMTVAEMAVACHWFTPQGDPYKSKVHRILQRLQTAKLARQYRDTWILTEAGKKAAAEADVARRGTETDKPEALL